MKKSITKRLIAGAVALIMVTLAGCSGKDKATDGNLTVKKNDPTMYNEAGVFPILKEKKTISVLTTANTLVQDFETNHYTKMIEEKVGVDLEISQLPATDGASKFAVMVASKTKLPDLLWGIAGSFDEYCYSGLVLPLNEYYADPEISYYFHKATTEEERELALKNTRLADGNNYGMIRYSQSYWNEYSYRAWINKTWLDKLGLPMPVTTDDFYNTLVAFKNNDLNGNGLKDEIPMMGSSDGWNQNPVPFIMNAFIYTDPKNNYLYVEDGKIDAAFNKEEWKEGLQYLNKLVKEGLLSPLTFTQNVSQFKTILEDPDKQVMGSIAAGSLTVYSSTESPNRADMQIMKPLTGPKGKNYATYNPSVPGNCTYISKYCEDPETAFRLCDFLYDKEMTISTRFGEKGLDWDYLTDKERKAYGVDMLGRTPLFKELRIIWGKPQNSHWGSITPSYQTEKEICLPSANDLTLDAIPLYKDKHPKEVISTFVHTSDELFDLSDVETSIKSYVQESMTRFVMGDKPFSEWDSYVQELDKMGLKQYLDIKQQAYDRMEGVK